MTRATSEPHLTRLEVQRLATIEGLHLDLHAGFHAFTGETGAGKSIIVDALGLLLGGRANSDLVRTGAPDMLVTGFWGEDVASRRVTSAGRSTARVDGEVVALRDLADWTGTRLTIHWQHSAQSLLTPANQRSLLDRLVTREVSAYTAAYTAWREARARLEALRAGERDRARQIDLLTYQVQEISAVNPQEGEEEPLRTELDRLANLDTIASGAASALDLLSDADVSAQALIAEALRAMNAAARFDPNVAQLQNELREALAGVQAVVGELRDVAERSAPDPEELANVETRLAQLGKLQTKYGPTLADVVAYGHDVAAQLEALQRDEQDSGTLEAHVETLRQAMLRAGEALRAARERAGKPLAAQLQGVVRELGMPHARLAFGLTPLTEPGPHGLDNVTLRFTANPGEDLGDLAEVASGGELSRVMLAISTVLGADTPSVVFDEVDAGIGGAAAVKVAEQLATLAQERQVLVVTHLAQIAARADHHYKVEKHLEGGRTVTRVRLLNREERLEEIARMLSGNTSDVALTHARELLDTR
ncbi:DNA repair protein RecN [Deinococcus maricopensis]|uniref:DNA repair protein RecN n=1 Tax=Deinococcus maricopensis (strain DSM 21211 / LMG 22137 / NRRL B-23946 / LB-34) TaxID=709986 RepID=E8U8L8_DEIML|nr:DNA repair protein RecN [Deinococcus maricopensis]ADV67407.1 DNA repair protein RecN [Deinococcus maricopensis DSM 21211]